MSSAFLTLFLFVLSNLTGLDKRLADTACTVLGLLLLSFDAVARMAVHVRVLVCCELKVLFVFIAESLIDFRARTRSGSKKIDFDFTVNFMKVFLVQSIGTIQTYLAMLDFFKHLKSIFLNI